ncbi:MAG TPA: replication initiator protein A [Gemmatirosa sp.]
MAAPPRRPSVPGPRAGGRAGARPMVALDRAFERLPLFRLSDSADDGALTYVPRPGARWRVLPAPGDRLPGTFDQDVYVGLLHWWAESGRPEDGAISFTLHAFLRALGRTPDGRTYEQLRGALTRLERTTLESTGGAYGGVGGDEAGGVSRSAVLASVVIERRRVVEEEQQEQLALFPELAATEPGDARVVLGPALRANVAAGRTSTISWARYQRLRSPVARRLYRLLTALWADGSGPSGSAVDGSEMEALLDTPIDVGGGGRCRVPLERWAEQLPLTQRYPSHLQRVLAPAHEMLVKAGVVRAAACVQDGRAWWVEYGAPSSAS